MKIGIIGSSNIGDILTHRFSAVENQISVADLRGPASLADLVRKTGMHAASGDEVTCGNDVIVIANLPSKISDLTAAFRAKSLAATIGVDTSNYYPQQRDGRVLAVACFSLDARAALMRLINGIGLDAVTVARVDNTWRQQSSSSDDHRDYNIAGVRQTLAAAHNERFPESHMTPISLERCASSV